MYRELIEKQAETNKYIHPHEGATEKEIAKAEKEMKVKFPAELSTLLSEMNGDGYLFMSTKTIVEYNKMKRDILGEVYEGLDKLLFFGENGCGDHYSYLIDGNNALEGNIVFWEHETNEYHTVAKDITELIKRYFNNEI